MSGAELEVLKVLWQDGPATVRDVAAQLGVLAEEKRQTIEIAADGAIPVAADRNILRRALINLLDNAIKYSPSSAPVRIAVPRTAAEARRRSRARAAAPRGRAGARREPVAGTRPAALDRRRPQARAAEARGRRAPAVWAGTARAGRPHPG